MREIPILFSTPMVQAILEGRKSMTRRVVKPQPDEKYSYCHGICTSSTDNKNVGCVGFGPSEVLVKQFIKPPYQSGDRLWVKETWAFIDNLNAGVGSDQYYEYKADTNNPLPGEWPIEAKEATTLRWKSPRFMPKVAARIWLEVVSVKVERLQGITEEDAVKEGVKAYGPNNCSGTSARIAFAELWDSLNAKRGYGWDVNPWVWVIEFKRVDHD